jgi:DNA-binding NtrC family response regulator
MKKNTVLLIDDEEILRVTLRNELTAAGYAVTTAAEGTEGIKKLNQGFYNLVLTDQVMGDIDGIQILRIAKHLHPEIAVIIITGYGNLAAAIDALRLGADDYLLKPCDLDELKFRIANCLEKQALRQKIKIYEDILSICSVCKKIRDDQGQERGTGKWLQPAEYLTKKTGVRMSHGLCQQCYEEAMKAIDK